MNDALNQLELFRSAALTAAVEEAISEVIGSPARPSANELLIGKVSGRIESMAEGEPPAPRPKPKKAKKKMPPKAEA